MHLNNNDYGKLFLGSPILFEDKFFIYPPTIKVYLNDDSNNLSKSIALLTLSKYHLKDIFNSKDIPIELKEKLEEMSVFDYLLASCLNDSTFLLELEKAFFTFLREKITIVGNLGMIVVGEYKDKRFINAESFPKFQNIIRAICMLPEVEEIPDNEPPLAKRFREAREYRDYIKSKKTDNSGNIGLEDLIALVCGYDMGVTPFNVGDLTLHALYTLLEIGADKERYTYSLKALLAGAKKNKVNPKHWVHKIEKKY